MIATVRLVPSNLAGDNLPAAAHGRVLHIFERAANFVFDEAGIISVVNPELGPGPFSWVLHEELAFDELLGPDSEVELRQGEILAGELRLDSKRATGWDPIPAWDSLEHRNLAWAVPILAEALAAAAIRPGITGWVIPTAWTPESAAGFAREMAGLGPGLTPSGDDVLMGVMHALWAALPAFEAQNICEWLAAEALPRTTTLSRAWLSAACKGMAGEPWHALMEAVQLKHEARLRRASQYILSTGHTSGADALAGFTKGIAN